MVSWNVALNMDIVRKYINTLEDLIESANCKLLL